MKKALATILALSVFALFADAKSTYVKGYTKKDGTQVSGYTRGGGGGSGGGSGLFGAGEEADVIVIFSSTFAVVVLALILAYIVLRRPKCAICGQRISSAVYSVTAQGAEYKKVCSTCVSDNLDDISEIAFVRDPESNECNVCGMEFTDRHKKHRVVHREWECLIVCNSCNKSFAAAERKEKMKAFRKKQKLDEDYPVSCPGCEARVKETDTFCPRCGIPFN